MRQHAPVSPTCSSVCIFTLSLWCSDMFASNMEVRMIHIVLNEVLVAWFDML